LKQKRLFLCVLGLGENFEWVQGRDVMLYMEDDNRFFTQKIAFGLLNPNPLEFFRYLYQFLSNT
jgi:hypothetical protein